MTENKGIKYILYARKSSESEDKQVLSIDSQISELTKLAQRKNLEIVKIITEAKSAKAPGREGFNKMLDQINEGKAQGIICWKLDRLARNPVDDSQIRWFLQEGKIKHIQTFERSYYPTDNALVMSVEFGVANQFILDLRVNTKRGLRTKVEKGWLPTTAPLGYLNNPLRRKGEKDIIKDPERFDLVRKMFDLMLSGNYTVPKILKIATDEWHLRNRRNKKISRSTLYRIFTNPFYYGIFEYPLGSGNWYKGSHEPMITEKEYDQIQILLGKKGKPRARKHIFSYTGLIRCGECGSMITADEKIKRQKNGNVHRYIYYFCTRKKDPNCSQRHAIREEELEKQILEILDNIKIPPEFHQWAINQLKEENKKEIADRNKILNSQQRAYKLCVQKIDRLIDMRANNEITSKEFLRKKAN